MRVSIDVSEVIDTVMAAGGLGASLSDAATVVNPCHTDGLLVLMPAAAEWLAAATGTQYGGDALVFDNCPEDFGRKRALMVSALAWRLFYLIYTGTDEVRAQASADIAAATAATIRQSGSAPSLTPAWW